MIFYRAWIQDTPIFYAYIQKNNIHSNNQIHQAIIQVPETWAEFEFALGEHTQLIETPEGENEDREKASEKLHEAFDEVLSDLGDYLQKQVNQSAGKIQAIHYAIK